MAEINCKNVTTMNLGDQGFEIQDSFGNGESVYIPNDGGRAQAAYEREIIGNLDEKKLTEFMDRMGVRNYARVNATKEQVDTCCSAALRFKDDYMIFPSIEDDKYLKIAEECKILGINMTHSECERRSLERRISGKADMNAICDKVSKINLPDVETGEIQAMCKKLRDR